MKQTWLLLVPSLVLTEVTCCLFDRIYEAVNRAKHRGWTSKLGGVESLGISKAGQTVLDRLMESQI